MRGRVPAARLVAGRARRRDGRRRPRRSTPLAYRRFLRYQSGWAAVPLGLLELGLTMALVRLLDIAAPLGPALWFFAGSWLVLQILGHGAAPVRPTHLRRGRRRARHLGTGACARRRHRGARRTRDGSGDATADVCPRVGPAPGADRPRQPADARRRAGHGRARRHRHHLRRRDGARPRRRRRQERHRGARLDECPARERLDLGVEDGRHPCAAELAEDQGLQHPPPRGVHAGDRHLVRVRPADEPRRAVHRGRRPGGDRLAHGARRLPAKSRAGDDAARDHGERDVDGDP